MINGEWVKYIAYVHAIEYYTTNKINNIEPLHQNHNN